MRHIKYILYSSGCHSSRESIGSSDIRFLQEVSFKESTPSIVSVRSHSSSSIKNYGGRTYNILNLLPKTPHPKSISSSDNNNNNINNNKLENDMIIDEFDDELINACDTLTMQKRQGL